MDARKRMFRAMFMPRGAGRRAATGVREYEAYFL